MKALPFADHLGDGVASLALAREQSASLTHEERRFQWDMEGELKMGIKRQLSEQELAAARRIREKMNVFRYGKLDAFDI